MKTLPEGLLEAMTKALVEELDSEAIYLFGSHAWGEPHEDSDVDLMVIVSDDTSVDDWRTRPSLRGRMALTNFDVAKDVVVRRKGDFDRLQSRRSSLARMVGHKGRRLYARP